MLLFFPLPIVLNGPVSLWAAVFKTIITSLPKGASETFSLETADLRGVDWNKLHYLALVDYQPGGVALLEPYDILQAAVAVPAVPVLDRR